MESVVTKDGSCTLFSKEFNQHYHNCNDGALNESFTKHILPAFEHHKGKKTLTILDICFGLGYNTLATIYYIQKNNLDVKLLIYSPEFDSKLLKELSSFIYPEEFQNILNIIQELSQNFYYKDQNYTIEIYNGDAREYLKNLFIRDISFDIVYQDPFSSDVNKLLWTKEYFEDISNLLNSQGIVTTYSIATPVRLSMYESGLQIYEIKGASKRKSTLALKEKSDKYKYIDMELKKQRNPDAAALRDK